MELFDEDVLKENTKKKKAGTNILLAIIILLVILCIIIVCLIISLQNSIFTVSVDGKNNAKLLEMLVFEENDSKVYVPIRKMAAFLGYESYNGEYLNPSEDTTKCYVESQNEVVNIALNSNQITKKELSNNSSIEKIDLEEPIKEINGELYTNIDGVEKIFNLIFNYSKDSKEIKVYTLQYLVDSYIVQLPDFGYTELKEGFRNQKAILNDILIAKNADEDYGVLEISTGNTILEPKYSDIEYLKNTNEFLVTSNGKKGIISYEKEIIIDIDYEAIEEINQNIYRVTRNGNMGLINKSGESIIYPKYDYIGIKDNKFEESQGENIILDDLVPIEENNKWAIFKTDGSQVTEFIYDSVGCVINNDREKKSVLFIEDYDVFIVEKDEKYYILKKDGTQAIEYGFDTVYKVDNEGKEEYYMTFNEGKTVDVIQWLEKLGIKKKN